MKLIVEEWRQARIKLPCVTGCVSQSTYNWDPKPQKWWGSDPRSGWKSTHLYTCPKFD